MRAIHNSILLTVFFQCQRFVALGGDTNTPKANNCASGMDEEERCVECMCKPGYFGSDCSQQCPHGTYGPQCRNLCRCSEPEQCDPVSGHCMQEDCQANWFSGSNCNRIRCSTLSMSFESDDTDCSRFYVCFPGNPYAYMVSCPPGLYWQPGSGQCRDKKTRLCALSGEQYVEGNHVTASTFTSFQDHLKRYLESIRCPVPASNPATSIVKQLQCPISLHNLHYADYNYRFRVQWSSFGQSQYFPTSVDIRRFYRWYRRNGFGIFRHDPNNCGFYHECVYADHPSEDQRLSSNNNGIKLRKRLPIALESSKPSTTPRNNLTVTPDRFIRQVIHSQIAKSNRSKAGSKSLLRLLYSAWGRCDGDSIFNYDWVTCTNASMLVNAWLGSTMPDPDKRDMCNHALSSRNNIWDISDQLTARAEAVYLNINSFVDMQS